MKTQLRRNFVILLLLRHAQPRMWLWCRIFDQHLVKQVSAISLRLVATIQAETSYWFLTLLGSNIHHIGLQSHSCSRPWHLPTPLLVSSFYRAMLRIRGTSHGPMSVCLCPSVTSRSSTKTAKRRITQTTPHDSPGSLVFWCQRSPRNLTGVTPYEGAECRWGRSKSATFDK